MAVPRVVRVSAFAKINLSLRVLGVRADGYHELRTVFQSIALHDTLTFQSARGPFRLECSDAACPVDRTNLVWRAADRVWAAARRRGEPRDVSVRIDKRIPMQAGLGGGSSDGAAALRVLASQWRVDRARLPEIAASLGADVPYFLQGGTVLGLDRGDLLFPLLDAPASWVTLVIPGFGVSTKDAYEWFDQRRLPARDLQNDLEAPVADHHPEIAKIVTALRRAGASSSAMSGSGSTVFGLFSQRADAERAARVLGRSDRKALVTRTVDRAAYGRDSARPLLQHV